MRRQTIQCSVDYYYAQTLKERTENFKRVCMLLKKDSHKHKETIMNGHDRHNPTILPITLNMSTTCFG